MRVLRLKLVENSVENVQNYFSQKAIVKFYFRLCKVRLDFFVKILFWADKRLNRKRMINLD